jgi:hypothetical protein
MRLLADVFPLVLAAVLTVTLGAWLGQQAIDLLGGLL